MFAVVSRGNTLSPYLKATSAAVGHKVIQIPVDPHHEAPIVASTYIYKEASSVKLINGQLKGVSSTVNALHQVRFAHTDIKIPDFDSYRRDSTKNPNKSARDTVAERQAFSYFITAGFGVGSAIFAKTAARSLVGMMSPAKDVLALAKVEVKLNDIPEGKN
ncbi:cytochrome b-c1 complex subunit Rieske-like protein, partial [Leptotrombidium deliense]